MTRKTVRTSEGLRNVLFDELDGIRNGTSDVKQANAVELRLAKTIVDVTKVEMFEYSRYEDIQLGSGKMKLGTGGGKLTSMSIARSLEYEEIYAKYHRDYKYRLDWET